MNHPLFARILGLLLAMTGGGWRTTIPRRTGSDLSLDGAVGLAGQGSRFVVADASNHRLVVVSQVISVDAESWGRVKARYRE